MFTFLDGDAQQDIVSYQPTYNNNLDINELLQDVSDSVVAEAGELILFVITMNQ